MSKITSIEIQKKNKNRVNIYIDEEYAFACNAELIYKQGLQKGNEIDLNSIKDIIYEDDIMKCKNSAIRILEKSYKTEKEIKDKLIDKGFSEQIIVEVSKVLKKYDLLNDKKYTDMYIKDRIKNQGRNKIKYSLIKKGISENLIEEKLENLNCEDEKNTAYILGEKKYNILIKREKDKFKLSQKLFRFLMGKGYNYECTIEVVNKIINLNEFME